MKENVLVDVIKEGLKVAFFVNKRSKDIFFLKKRKLKGRGYKKVLLKKRGSSAFIKSHIRGYKLYKSIEHCMAFIQTHCLEGKESLL